MEQFNVRERGLIDYSPRLPRSNDAFRVFPEAVKGDIHEVLNDKDFFVESYRSADITPQIIQEISDFFRYTFNNEFEEYATCTKCDEGLSAIRVFQTNGSYVSLEDMDNTKNLPDCPCCGEKMEFFHDPDAIFEKIEKKFSNDAFVTVLRHKETSEIIGMTFAYYASFEEVFKNEWSSSYGYMANPAPEFNRDINAFIEGISQKLDYAVSPDMEVLCWNCISIHPDHRGRENFLSLTHDLFSKIDSDPRREQKSDFMVMEVINDSTMHNLTNMGGSVNIYGVLDDGYVFMFADLTGLSELFQLSSEDFKARSIEAKARKARKVA